MNTKIKAGILLFVYPLVGWIIAWKLGIWSWLFAVNIGEFITYYTNGKYHKYNDEVKYMLFGGWQLTILLPFKKRIFDWLGELDN